MTMKLDLLPNSGFKYLVNKASKIKIEKFTFEKRAIK